MSLFIALRRLMQWPAPPPPAAPKPFDDGLVQLARLIDVDDPVTTEQSRTEKPARRA